MGGVRAWLVVCVVCLTSAAQGQLGVEVVDKGTQRPVTSTTTTTNTTQLPPHTHEKEQEGKGEDTSLDDPSLVWSYYDSYSRRDEWWRRLPDTYQGCFQEEQGFNGTLMFVNLTEVMEVNKLGSAQHACFHMCRIKSPLANYIAISPAVSSGADGCGCKDLLDSDSKVTDERCDALEDHYRVYCGPNNTVCLNQCIKVTGSSLLLSLAALLSYVSCYGGVYS